MKLTTTEKKKTNYLSILTLSFENNYNKKELNLKYVQWSSLNV